MKAITQAAFGSADVLQLREVPKPSPQAGEVLVQVWAGSPNPWDWHFMRGLPYISRLAGAGLRKPKNTILGSDVAGQVEAVGAGVTQFHPGDAVFGFVGAGAFAEYVSVPKDFLGPKPANLTFEQAATIPLAGMTALQGLRDVGQIRAGQHVLIIGASGGVGTLAVQIAKSFGATVTGVCSTQNVELVRSIGADHVIDYTRDDVTRRGTTYDLIFQLGGTTSPGAFRRILTPSGRLVLSSGDSHWPCHRPDGPDGRSRHPVGVHRPDAAATDHEAQPPRPRTAEGPDRGRQSHTGHRSHLPLERIGGRRAPPRGGTRTGQARYFRSATR